MCFQVNAHVSKSMLLLSYISNLDNRRTHNDKQLLSLQKLMDLAFVKLKP